MLDVTVEEFKSNYPRFSPMYLPIFTLGNTYFKDDVVFYNNLFYKCIVENTVNTPDNTQDWTLYNDSTLNYTRDEDIEEAIDEASINFNENLFEDEEKAKTVFMLLVAHYLTVDFNNAMGNNQVGIMTSKSVGSVSQGYSIPSWLSSNPALSAYTTTGYGVKYATLIQPYLCGQIILSKGRITYG